jgi:hypothetical protein
MISAHVIQLVTEEPPRMGVALVGLCEPRTFSGFLLAFGIGVGLSRPRRRGLWERAVPVVKVLLAVWASSWGFVLLVDRAPLDGWVVREVMTTEVLWGWSEFLTSFLVLYLLLAVARPVFVWVGTRPGWMLAASVAALGTTLVTTGAYWPLIGGLVGHRGYPNFPLLAYLPWFLAGIHLAGRRIGGADLALGAAATGVFALWVWQQGGALPERFPPSLLWVIGPGLPLALYLWACESAWAAGAARCCLAAGRHVLVALVLSNLLIFGIRYLWGFPCGAAGPSWPLAPALSRP